MEEINYYTDLRRPAYNNALAGGQRGEMGRFDPLNGGVLLLDDRISRVLAKGERAEFDVVEAGDMELLAFATYLHEIIHWWQHIGTTAGLFYGLSVAVQANATTFYLDKIGDSVAKPILHNLRPGLPRDHPALLAVTRWLEVEYGAAFLGDHRLLIPKVRGFKYFESLGYSLLMLYANTVATLNTLFDPDGESLPGVDHFLERYDRFASGRFPDFKPKEVVFPALSTTEIFEGQARINELQYRSMTYEPLTWQQLKDIGYLKGDYGVAFDTYLSLTQFEEPRNVQDATVNLFLLVCEIALNPGEGYADEIAPESNFVRAVHPGHRFLKLCVIAKSNPSLLDKLKSVSLSAYEDVSEYLCQRAGWDTPTTVWKKVLARTGAMRGVPALDDEWRGGAFTPENVSIRFYFAAHRDILETKTQIPHFFCWPGYFLLDISGDADEVNSMQEILRLHQPPFQSSSLTEGVTSCNIAHFTAEEKTKLMSDYFGTQVLYNLVRQWMSGRGAFQMKYGWKPQLNDSERDILKQRFRAVFDRPLDTIPVK